MLVKALKDMVDKPSQNQDTELGGQSADILLFISPDTISRRLWPSTFWERVSPLTLCVLWKWQYPPVLTSWPGVTLSLEMQAVRCS